MRFPLDITLRFADSEGFFAAPTRVKNGPELLIVDIQNRVQESVKDYQE